MKPEELRKCEECGGIMKINPRALTDRASAVNSDGGAWHMGVEAPQWECESCDHTAPISVRGD